MEKVKLTLEQSYKIRNGTDKLNALRDDSAIKLFEIESKIQDAFNPLEKNHEKIEGEKLEIIEAIAEEVEALKKDGDSRVSDTVVQRNTNGAIQIRGVPKFLQDKYKGKTDKKDEEIDRTLEKTKEIEIEKLSIEELKKYGCVTFEVLKIFNPVIDM